MWPGWTAARGLPTPPRYRVPEHGPGADLEGVTDWPSNGIQRKPHFANATGRTAPERRHRRFAWSTGPKGTAFDSGRERDRLTTRCSVSWCSAPTTTRSSRWRPMAFSGCSSPSSSAVSHRLIGPRSRSSNPSCGRSWRACGAAVLRPAAIRPRHPGGWNRRTRPRSLASSSGWWPSCEGTTMICSMTGGSAGGG